MTRDEIRRSTIPHDTSEISYGLEILFEFLDYFGIFLSGVIRCKVDLRTSDDDRFTLFILGLLLFFLRHSGSICFAIREYLINSFEILWIVLAQEIEYLRNEGKALRFILIVCDRLWEVSRANIRYYVGLLPLS